MKISHIISPRKCFSSAEWMGNLYVCPICGSSIACGANGHIFVYPPYNRYLPLVDQIPVQPEWYIADSGWDGVHRFMKETLEAIGNSDVDIDKNEEETSEDHL